MDSSKALIPLPICHLSGCRKHARKHGFFKRKCDGKSVQRFRCLGCGRCFSDSTDTFCYRQHKPEINSTLFCLLSGGYSLRRAAIDLRVNRKTVVRKFLLLGKASLELLPQLNFRYPKAKIVQFDDLETFEHTKCKPLSVTLAVEEKTRRILGFETSQMPAKGKLAKISRKKYGKRADHRPAARRKLFTELKELIRKDAEIKSDQNPHYTNDVRTHFPNHVHRTFKGKRGCVVGQGELKSGRFDHLFYLNHTCAMLRENLNRLTRRTWSTTKNPQRLQLHIAIYAIYHNEILLKRGRKAEALLLSQINELFSRPRLTSQVSI